MKAKLTLLIIAIINSNPLANSAGEMEPRQGFFWGAGLGAGFLDRSFSHTTGVDDAATRFYMEAFGGYAINPHVSIGMEIGGWLIEPDSDTYQWNPYWPPDNERAEEPQGEGLSQIVVFTRIYPYREHGGFIKLSGGYMDRWVKTSSGRYNDEGWTTAAGVGWDYHVSGNWSVTPTLSYSYGEADSQTHQAVTLSLGFMWHQWKGPDRFKKEPALAYWEGERNRVTTTDSDSESQYPHY